MKNISKHSMRVFEKIPGINPMQYATIQGRSLVMTPKIGTRSIRDSILASRFNGSANRNLAWDYIFYTSRSDFMREMNKPETILFVRDPLDRLHSCWKQKISWQRDPGFFYFFQYYPRLKPDMSFLEFLKAITAIGLSHYEKHFLPISFGLDISNLRLSIIEISDINRVLSDILGREFGTGLRSNATLSNDITVEESSYFAESLSDLFLGDYELLKLAETQRPKLWS